MENDILIEYDNHKFTDEVSTVEEKDFSVKTDAEFDEIELTTGNPHTNVKVAKQDFLKQNSPLQDYALKSLQYLDVEPQKFQENVENYYEKERTFVESEQYFYEQAIALKDPEIVPTDLRIASNNRIAQSIIDRYMDQQETGWVDAIFDTGAMIGYEIYRSPKVLVSEDEFKELGNQFIDNLIKMEPKEFNEYFEELSSDIMSRGLREDSIYNLLTLKDIVHDKGFTTWSDRLGRKTFAALDVLGISQLTAGGLKLALKTARKQTLISRVSNNEGPEAARRAAEKKLARSLDEEVKADVGPASLNPHLNDKAPLPSESSISRLREENRIIEAVKEMNSVNAIGRILPEAEVATLAGRIGKQLQDSFNNPVYKAKHANEEGVFLNSNSLGDYTVTVQFGRATDGQPYKPTKTGKPSQGVKDAALRAEGEVVEVTDELGKIEGYVIQKRVNLNLAKEVPEITDMWEGVMNLERSGVRVAANKLIYGGTRGFQSAAARDLPNLHELGIISEGSAARLGEVIQEIARPIEKLGPTDNAALNSIIKKLRDNPIESSKRVYYSEEAFAAEYYSLMAREPSENVMAAYRAAVEISEADHILRSSNVMQQYVRSGYQALKLPNGFRVPALRVSKTSVPEQSPILDIVDNQITYKEFVEPKADIWRLDKEYEGSYFVTRPKSVDALDPEDVLGYNAGGPRTNPTAQWFVVGGDYSRGRMKTFLSATVKSDADKAVQEINNILKAQGSDNIDDIVQQNHSWNPAINTFDEFKAFAEKNGWNLESTPQLAVKERNVPIKSPEGEDDVFNGMAMSEFIDNDMRRNDRVLPHYGGFKTANYDPITNIFSAAVNSVQEFSSRAHTVNTMVSWVKMAKRLDGVELPKGVPESDYYSLFMGASFKGRDPNTIRAKELWNVGRRRLNVKRQDEVLMQRLGQAMGDFVFETTRRGSSIKWGDPTNIGLKIGFMSKFGFFNPKQLIVQMQHVQQIMFISPTQGSRGTSMALLMRGIFAFPSFKQEGLRRMAKVYNLPEKTMEEIYEFVVTSGRANLETEIAELNTGFGRGLSSYKGENYNQNLLYKSWEGLKKYSKQGAQLSLIPFREGDRLARMSGDYTALLEYIAKNPGESILTESARRQIMRRADVLNFHMTSTSNAAWQKGPLRLPTQWLSYTFRSMEAVFVGRDLTPLERVRLGFALTAFYGFAGFGFTQGAEYLADKLGLKTDDEFFTFLKWGFQEAVIDLMLEDEKGRVGVGLTTSFAPAGQLIDLAKKIDEGRFLEVSTGPAGQISKDITVGLFSLIDSIVNSNEVLIKENAINVLRNITTLDSLAKANGIRNLKRYRGKSGAKVPGEFTETEAYITALGFSPLKVQEYYAAKPILFNAERKIRKERRTINRLADKAHDLIRTGDLSKVEEGTDILKGLALRIELLGISEKDKMSLRKAVITPMKDELPQLLLKLHDKVSPAMADRLKSTLTGN